MSGSDYNNILQFTVYNYIIWSRETDERIQPLDLVKNVKYRSMFVSLHKIVIIKI